ncbi:MAG: hypothetical protein V1908_02745, partial [Candidatus Peregrinibacteria bacterium]
MSTESPLTFWDPAGEALTAASFSQGRREIEEKFNFYETHPKRPLRNLLLCIGLIPLTAIFFALFPKVLQELLATENGVYLLILPFIPTWLYWRHIRKIQCDLIKMLIARQSEWLYSPKESRNRWSPLASRFSEFFQKGNEAQNVQDEFWGTAKGEKQNIPFYSSIFEYTVVTHGSKGRRHRTTYTKTIVGVKLNKTLAADFRLEPEGALMKFFNFFRRNEIDTESEEFNKSFAVFYKGEKMDKELGIIKALSPAVQVQLLELKKKEGPFSLLFRGDAALLMFDGQLLKKMHTNFFRSIQLDPRDSE